jgi:putative lipoic acid-binding regulatory protein
MTLPSDQIDQFPSAYSLKAIGKSEGDFEDVIYSILLKHIPSFDRTGMTSRLSRDGNYLSVTISFNAESKEQVESLFKELNAHERVIIVL